MADNEKQVQQEIHTPSLVNYSKQLLLCMQSVSYKVNELQVVCETIN